MSILEIQGEIMKRTFSDEAILFFCRLGIAGLARKAPGTWGTFEACLLAPFVFLPLSIFWRSVALIALFILGGLAATRAEKLLGQKDPGQVVIDELVGVWLVLLPFQKAGFWTILAAFLFFRLFDITKPGPIRASENWLPDGFGVMIDDVMAGFAALFCVAVLRFCGMP